MFIYTCLFLVSSFSSLWGIGRSEPSTAICNPQFCNGGANEKFIEMCSAKLSHRCCIMNNTIIGLDWSNCLVSSFEASTDLLNLKFIFMNGKGNSVCLNQTLRGFTDLEYVSLNGNCECPGGNSAWQEVSNTEGILTCQNQTDSCVIESSNYCPNVSHCVDDGPGMRQCLCNSDFHGYKCLREGTFPTTTFIIGWSASMIVVGLALLGNRQYFIRKGSVESRLFDSTSNNPSC